MSMNSFTLEKHTIHFISINLGDVKAAVIDDVVYVAGGSSGGEPACK